MNTILIYGIIFVILIALELVYFKIADTFNIIDKPNERSSHSTIVLRGGGIIFLFKSLDMERIFELPIYLVPFGCDSRCRC